MYVYRSLHTPPPHPHNGHSSILTITLLTLTMITPPSSQSHFPPSLVTPSLSQSHFPPSQWSLLQTSQSHFPLSHGHSSTFTITLPTLTMVTLLTLTMVTLLTLTMVTPLTRSQLTCRWYSRYYSHSESTTTIHCIGSSCCPTTSSFSD